MRGPSRRADSAGCSTLGWIPVRGESMWPALRSGDLAGYCTACAAAPARRGDVLVARLGNALVAHRVVRVATDGLTLRGDASGAEDPIVAPSAVLGRVELVRRGGRVLERGDWDRGLGWLGRAARALARRAARRGGRR